METQAESQSVRCSMTADMEEIEIRDGEGLGIASIAKCGQWASPKCVFSELALSGFKWA